MRRGINRAKADYVRIEDGLSLKVIINKPVKSCVPLKDTLKDFLEAVLPKQTISCPVSTSRGWEQCKNTKRDTEYKLVTHTELPLFDQLVIARDLGARIRWYGEWVSPEDVDEDEWENQFIKAVRKREADWMNGNEKVRNMIARHYDMDAIFDELDKEDYEERARLGRN